ncbi:SRPBCC family protein [Stackebrandtia nassauensis]|nr:SRPBCC family protein [Stackebrandtia nassauensis]
MVDSSTQSISIAAPAAVIAEVIADFQHYPEWISGMKSTEVLEEFDDGYGHLVRFHLDAGVFKDVYELRYEYSDDLTRISWTLDQPSSVQKAQVGSYDLSEHDDGTTVVTYTLAVDLSIPMLGMFKRKAEKMIMDSALKELKKRVEAAE